MHCGTVLCGGLSVGWRDLFIKSDEGAKWTMMARGRIDIWLYEFAMRVSLLQ